MKFDMCVKNIKKLQSTIRFAKYVVMLNFVL